MDREAVLKCKTRFNGKKWALRFTTAAQPIAGKRAPTGVAVFAVRQHDGREASATLN